jgi:hypothetical protein
MGVPQPLIVPATGKRSLLYLTVNSVKFGTPEKVAETVVSTGTFVAPSAGAKMSTLPLWAKLISYPNSIDADKLKKTSVQRRFIMKFSFQLRIFYFSLHQLNYYLIKHRKQAECRFNP